ncbi:MAG: peptidyl-prolyl cis-trans isomerase [Deltaproteobacteria bacterium]
MTASHQRLVYLAFAVSLLVSSCEIEQPEEKVVLTVGKREVTAGVLKKQIKRMTSDMEMTERLGGDVLEPMLERLIERYLVLEYGKEQGIVVSEKEVEGAVKEIRNAYSDKDFQEMLLQGYMDLEEWKEGVRERLLMKKIMEEVSEDMNAVPFQEIKAYYEENLEEFKQPAMVRFRQMVTSTKDEAAEIVKRLREGEDMAKLAMTSPRKPGMEEVGEPTWIARDNLEASMEKAIFSLEVGEISDVVETAYGFHVFEVLEKRPEGIKTLPDAMAEIESRLSCQRKERLYRKWVRHLRETFPVQINRELLNTLELG